MRMEEVAVGTAKLVTSARSMWTLPEHADVQALRGHMGTAKTTKKTTEKTLATPHAPHAVAQLDGAVAERCRVLAERLDALETAARGSRVVFGSTQHEWKRGAPLDASALERLETRLHGRLPDEARVWLSTVSSSGSGPNYGLLVPLVRKGGSPARPFLSSKKTGAAPFDGCLVLADEGCGMASVLVLNGKNRGQVWSVAHNGSRQRRASDFLSWIEDWWVRAAVEWCGARLFGAVAAGAVPRVVGFLEPLLDAALASAGENASNDALLASCWMRAAAGRFDEAEILAERAAATFVDANATSDPKHVAKQEMERKARHHLYQSRLLRLSGKKPEARREAEAGLALERTWASTRDELAAERDVC